MKLKSQESRAYADESTRALVFFLLALVVACVLRFPDREVRPMHLDESTQAVKLHEVMEGTYHYDPVDHHGPTLLLSTLPVKWFGHANSWNELNESDLRLVPALYGVALLLLLLLVSDGMSRMAVAWAAMAIAVSPVMVFYSRYYIMEMLLVFFSFGLIGCWWRWYMTREGAWLAAGGVCAGLMHATKETCVLHFAAMAAGLAAVAVVELFSAGSGLGVVNRNKRKPLAKRQILLFLGCAAGVSVLIFSKGLRDWQAVVDSIGTYVKMTDRAGGQGHEKPFWYYFSLIWGGPMREDPAGGSFFANMGAILGFTGHPAQGWRIVWTERGLLFLAVLGIGSAFLAPPGRNQSQQLVRFISVYSIVCFVIYSAISYKTPWCVLGAWHGMLIMAGVGAAALVRFFFLRTSRIVATAVVAVVMVQAGVLAWHASRTYAADSRLPYNYSMTARDCLEWVQKIYIFAELDPAGDQLRIVQADPQGGWPLPWFLGRKFPHYIWQGGSYDDMEGADVILCADSLQPYLPESVSQPEVTDAAARAYIQQTITLHTSGRLQIYVKKPLWEAYLAKSPWPQQSVQH